MPFLPHGLSDALRQSLDVFLRQHDMTDLYRRHSWANDSWAAGFPDMLQLESELSAAARTGAISSEHVRKVAVWGRLRNLGHVRTPARLELPLYVGGTTNPELELNPLLPMRQLLSYDIQGLGPTFLSKLLWFALPSEYGAIDTHLVRTFGQGDPDSQRYNWLALKVRNHGYGWYIPGAQSAWPREYGTWVQILRYFAQVLNMSRVACPHPEAYVTRGLRAHGLWLCADVEMALFTYALP